jgi:hypothetical protein
MHSGFSEVSRYHRKQIAILDRAYGKPSQSIEMSGDRTTLVDLLVGMNKSHTVDGEPKADRAGGGDNDDDLHRAADPVH